MPKLVAFNTISDHPLFLHFAKVSFEDDQTTIITGTGFNYLIIPFGDLKIATANETHILNGIYLNSISIISKLSAKKGDNFVVIRLKSDRIHKISGLDMNTTNTFLPLENVIPKHFCNAIHEASKKCNSCSDYINVLDSYMNAYYPVWCGPSAISNIIDYIFRNNGMMNVSDLITHFSVSHSTLNRNFKKIVGMTSNKFLRMIRFNYIMRHIETGQMDVLSIIEAYKYYDYSHFTKDFKAFTEQTPKQFFGSKHPLLRDILYKKITYYNQ